MYKKKLEFIITGFLHLSLLKKQQFSYFLVTLQRHELMKFSRKFAENAYNLKMILEEVEKIPVVYDK